MRRCIAILTIIFLAALAGSFISTGESLSRITGPQQELTDKDELKDVNTLYKKAVEWIKDGEETGSPQRAEMLYFQAESNLSTAISKLKELSSLYSLDVLKELEECEKLQREAHIRAGQARREQHY